MSTTKLMEMRRPPGTGKTSTICGLIARFLTGRPRLPVPVAVGNKPPPNLPSSRILLCAPSNAAIDELAQRINDGVFMPQQNGKSLCVVRVGTDQAINNSVKEISLDYLVDQKLECIPNSNSDTGNDIHKLRMQLDQVKLSRANKLQELTNMPVGTPTMGLENEVKCLNSLRQTLTTKLDELKDKQKSDGRTLDTLRRNTRREILANADIVCSTLSGSGHEILESLEFDMMVIDEAAQAIELSSLIPLKYGCSKCVMVGDPQQLPPTVISQDVRLLHSSRRPVFWSFAGVEIWL